MLAFALASTASCRRWLLVFLPIVMVFWGVPILMGTHAGTVIKPDSPVVTLLIGAVQSIAVHIAAPIALGLAVGTLLLRASVNRFLDHAPTLFPCANCGYPTETIAAVGGVHTCPECGHRTS